MKITMFCTALMIAFTIPAWAAQHSAACEAKRASIEAQISEANARGRKQDVAGLKRALAANKTWCTDESLAKERATDIRNARRKVAAREKSLAEAERKGDTKKIEARKKKLDEARHDLAEAEKPLGP